jgi:hypothetical protein
MLSEEVLSIPAVVCPRKTYILSKRIAAVRLTRADTHRGKLGEIVQLPPGAHLAYCGDGYNERTAKVHYAGEFYFVFLRDLQDAGSNSS